MIKLKSLLLSSAMIFFFVTTASATDNRRPSANNVREMKAKVCTEKQDVVKKRLSNLIDMSDNMVKVFTNIAERSQQFYENKVVVKGGKVENYSALIATVNTKKEAVRKSIEAANMAASQFKCDSENPREQLASFKAAMRDVQAKLKELRVAVRNLVTAVHTANKEIKVTPVATE